ncbi:MAG TPA: DUF4252 domain-containing protein [Steroidobacteraceae bacterium]|nr:DUF4252 domain-containing protein [Steroidobacteraceae bacterium]
MRFRAFSAALAAATALALPVAGFGVEPELNIPNFSHLKHKATESVDVTLDGFLMRIAQKFAASHAAEEAHDEAISILQDIKSVRVRNFTFDSDNAYSMADIDSVRKQLKAPGWSALVQVHRRDNEDVDVYVCLEDDKVKGLAVIASEPREFTIVNIVGSIDLDKISQLEGEFGIPRMSEQVE